MTTRLHPIGLFLALAPRYQSTSPEPLPQHRSRQQPYTTTTCLSPHFLTKAPNSTSSAVHSSTNTIFPSLNYQCPSYYQWLTTIDNPLHTSFATSRSPSQPSHRLKNHFHFISTSLSQLCNLRLIYSLASPSPNFTKSFHIIIITHIYTPHVMVTAFASHSIILIYKQSVHIPTAPSIFNFRFLHHFQLIHHLQLRAHPFTQPRHTNQSA